MIFYCIKYLKYMHYIPCAGSVMPHVILGVIFTFVEMFLVSVECSAAVTNLLISGAILCPKYITAPEKTGMYSEIN